MDNEKTGKLIADARRAKGLTQSGLAKQLNVSDRAVSKWERGRGFPDVSLIDPLGEALGLTPAEILRGEKSAEIKTSEILSISARQKGQKLLRAAAIALTVLFLLWFLYTALGIGKLLFTHSLDKTVTARIYDTEGNASGEADVYICGTWAQYPGEPGSYAGTFATNAVPRTMNTERAKVFIKVYPYNPSSKSGLAHISMNYGVNPDDTAFAPDCYIGYDMESFAVMTADGTVIATHKWLAKLLLDAKRDKTGLPCLSWN